MKEHKLLECCSEIDDEILERSEHNIKKKSRANFWKRFGAVAAAVILLAGISVLFLIIVSKNGSESGNKSTSPLIRQYIVSAAEYPEIDKKPEISDFAEVEGNKYDSEATRAYRKALFEWEYKINELKNVDGYDPDAGKKGIMDFTSGTMRKFLKKNNNENTLFSPLNIYIALGMLAETSEGETRKQVLDLLGMDNIEDVRIRMKGLWNSVYSNSDYRCILGSSVWLRDDTVYNKQTLDSLAENYYTSSFSGKMESEEFSATLRDWLNEQTDGLLKEQIDGMKFSDHSIMNLVTTISFSARWNGEYRKENTEEGIFHSSKGDNQCDFMHLSRTQNYYWGEKFGAIEKGLDSPGGYVQLILPDEGVDVYELLEDKEVLDFIDKGNEYENKKYLIVNESVPKFDVSSNQDISDILKELGITDAFDAYKADFSPVTDEPVSIWLDSVEHGVRVITDEEGVKAAAYTRTVLLGATAIAPPDEEIDFVLDRPFMFVIRSQEGIPLFVGIVEKP